MADVNIQVINKGNVEELAGKGDINLYEIKYTSKSGDVYDMTGFHIKNAFEHKNAFVIIGDYENLNTGPETKNGYCLWIRFKKNNRAVIEYINKRPICGRSRMPARGTGSMMMDISQYILKMFGVKESSLHDQAFIIIDGFQISTAGLFTMLTGYPWYSKWGYFPRDKKSKKIIQKNYDLVHKTIMTKRRLTEIRNKLRDKYYEPIDPSFLRPRRKPRSGMSEADNYYANKEAIANLMRNLKDFYKLEDLPFNEFYSQLLDSYPVVALQNMHDIMPEGINLWEASGDYFKFH